MKPARSFASDNNAGVHPEILKAVGEANRGHAVGYGDDPYTASVVQKFKQRFGQDIEVFFVFNGTAANCLSLKALTNSYNAVICGEAAHIYTDECGAPEKFTGCKLLPVPVTNGKLTVEAVSHAYHGIDDPHHVQPRVISITQATEVGTVYQPDEIRPWPALRTREACFCTSTGPVSPTLPPAWAKLCGKPRATWEWTSSPSEGQRTAPWEPKPWFSSTRSWAMISCICGNKGCSWHPKCVLSPRNSMPCLPAISG